MVNLNTLNTKTALIVIWNWLPNQYTYTQNQVGNLVLTLKTVMRLS